MRRGRRPGWHPAAEADLPEGLPRVIVSSVVRSTHPGDSHGGIFLVDLVTGDAEQVLDWDDPSIGWEGRGGDRGLRGIACHGGRVYLAASDELFVFDCGFRRLASFRNPYLKHCHEIDVMGDLLYLTSTGFDSILEFDLAAGAFRRGLCLRKADGRLDLHEFDPAEDSGSGPAPGDSVHLNSVTHRDGQLFVGGTGLDRLYRIDQHRLGPYARVPLGTHNARPFRSGVLVNDTEGNCIRHLTRRGRALTTVPIPRPDAGGVVNGSLPADIARPGFGRGLAVIGDGLVVGGSSPATVTVYRLEPPRACASVTLTNDVRNAVHGLEIWPFDDPLPAS